jgi:hypothetical protein
MHLCYQPQAAMNLCEMGPHIVHGEIAFISHRALGELEWYYDTKLTTDSHGYRESQRTTATA